MSLTRPRHWTRRALAGALATGLCAAGQGRGNLTSNPLITGWDYAGEAWVPADVFRLSTGSPARGAGHQLDTDQMDFRGRPVPASIPVNMGADNG